MHIAVYLGAEVHYYLYYMPYAWDIQIPLLCSICVGSVPPFDGARVHYYFYTYRGVFDWGDKIPAGADTRYLQLRSLVICQFWCSSGHSLFVGFS